MSQTPSEKWKDTIEFHKDKCKKILKKSDNIRYVGAVNVYGHTLTGLIRPKVKPIMKSEVLKKDLFVVSTLLNLRKGNTKVLGNLNYTLIQHNKISIIVFQKFNIIYYITISKKEKNIYQLINSLKKII